MLRAILADHDPATLEHVKTLIDWRAEGIDVIGTALTGDELVAQIKTLHPDLVILDTDLEGDSDWGGHFCGLDIVAHYKPFHQQVRFIVMSDKTDYEMLKRAIRIDALDYLLKPVDQKEMQNAVRLALDHARSRDEMEALLPDLSEFREDPYESGILQIPDSDDQYCQKILDTCNIDFATEFGVGIYIGIVPEISAELSRINYQKFTILTLAIYSRILTYFRENNIGFEVRRTAHRIRMMGVFMQGEEQTFVMEYLLPLLNDLEASYDTKLCIGVGSYAYAQEQLYSSYKDAQYSHELYFFEQKPLITWYDHRKEAVRIPAEDYEKRQDEVIRAVLSKDPDVFAKIEGSIDAMAQTHYGNWQALIMRAMNYTGEISSRLRRYRLIEEDFFIAQDELQNHLLQAVLYPDVKRELMDYFRKLLPKVYKNTRHSGKVAIEQVKTYMQDNFMRDLSIKELSEVACVSTNYFSHMFKNETGQNYKAYLTNIRLEHALELLLNSDYGLYEISERAGYQNVRTFVDAFKQKYGLSPTKYKKKLSE